MTGIGGFFEVETRLGGRGEYHCSSLRVASGRVAFRIALEQLKPSKVWLPDYCCHSLLDPLRLLSIPYEFYTIGEGLTQPDLESVPDGECVLAINYFGIQTSWLRHVGQSMGRRLIIDNTQAFFDPPVPKTYSFNSARKFFGVPDGAYLFSPEPLQVALRPSSSASIEHMKLRSIGQQELAYAAHLEHERSFTANLEAMSSYSRATLSRIDYRYARERRIANFRMYEVALSALNRLEPRLETGSVPYAYPLLLRSGINRSACHRAGVYFPRLWPELMCASGQGASYASLLSELLIPLPVDHRYGADDVQRVVTQIRSQL